MASRAVRFRGGSVWTDATVCCAGRWTSVWHRSDSKSIPQGCFLLLPAAALVRVLLTKLDLLLLELRFFHRMSTCLGPVGCWRRGGGECPLRVEKVDACHYSRRSGRNAQYSRKGPKKTSKNINLALIKKYFYSERSERERVGDVLACMASTTSTLSMASSCSWSLD